MDERVFDLKENSASSSVTFSSMGIPRKDKDGDRVIFRVRSEQAEEVFLVGSFNEWSETDQFERVSYGIWEITLPKGRICEGDTYKFKLKMGGTETYFTDPCALENKGEPHYDSVYREPDSATCIIPVATETGDFSSRPFNIFSLRVDRLFGGSERYSDIARELIPYVMQMGYTHVSLSGIFENYHDFSSDRSRYALFAPRKEQGGIDELRVLVSELHRFGIGVLIDVGYAYCGNDIYAYADFCKENARYWLECYGFDGIVVFFDLGAEANVIEGIKHDLEDTCLIIQSDQGMSLCCADKMSTNLESASDLFLSTEDRDCELLRNAAKMSYSLVLSGWGYTNAGSELGLSTEEINNYEISPYSPDKNSNFQYQLLISDLNDVYLSTPCLWRCNKRRIKKTENTLTVECSGGGKAAVLAIDLKGTGEEIMLPFADECFCKFSSCSKKYGFGKTNSSRLVGNRLSLEPYEAVIIACEAGGI